MRARERKREKEREIEIEKEREREREWKSTCAYVFLLKEKSEKFVTTNI